MSIIDLKHISYETAGNQILKDVTFSVPEGTGFALLGPNGAGKTTSIRAIGGLIAPSSGEVTVAGSRVDPRNAHLLREKMGFQLDGALYERLTAEENLKLWGSLYGERGEALQKKIDNLLDLFHLNDRRDSKLSEFSKGMKQQVALCRAIISNPPILVLDEPTSGLSPEVAENVISYISEFKRKNNSTILLCTHELFGLEKLVDSICVINDGKTLANGNVNDLISSYWPEKFYRMVIEGQGHEGNPLWLTPLWNAKELNFAPNGNHTEISFISSPDELQRVVTSVWDANLTVESVELVRFSLRDLYFEILKREVGLQ